MDPMEIDDSIHVKRNLTMEGLVTKVDFQRRNPPSRCVSVALGLLCAVLLAGNVGQFLYSRVPNQPDNEMCGNRCPPCGWAPECLYPSLWAAYGLPGEGCSPVLGEESRCADQLQGTSHASAAERTLFEATLSNLTKEKDQLQTIYDELQREKNDLQTQFNTMRTNRDELQRSYTSLKSDKDQLQTNKEALQGRYNTLQREKDQLQTNYRSLSTEKDQLEKNINKERGDLMTEKDRLQQSLNTLTQEKNQLQTNYNDMQKNRDNLQREKNDLQTQFNTMRTNRDDLQRSYTSLKSDKDQLQISKEALQGRYNTLQREKDQLQTNYRSLSTVKDQLETKITTLQGPCQGGWTKFGCSCYYLTVQNRTWTESRDYCISQGGDLAIINSRDEQVFVNGLLGLGEYAWIGLTDSVTEGTWKWVDGTPVTTTFWFEGEPNSHEGKNEDCGDIWHLAAGRGWSDQLCSVKSPSICEK